MEIKRFGFDFDFIDRRYVEQHHRPAPTVITTRTAITSNVHGSSSVSTNKSTTTSSSTKISDTVSRVEYNACGYILVIDIFHPLTDIVQKKYIPLKICMFF